MKIRIPNVDDKECYIEDKQSIVLLGANGAGKTRMSVWIDENNPELNIHRISAQKSLNMPEYVSPTELKKAEDKFLYGTEAERRIFTMDTTPHRPFQAHRSSRLFLPMKPTKKRRLQHET